SDCRHQFEPLHAKRNLVPCDAGDVEQVVNQPRHVRHLAVDHIPQFLELWIRRSNHLERLYGVADRRKGISEFVREHGQEFILVAVGCAQRRRCHSRLMDVKRAAGVAQEFTLRGKSRHGHGTHPSVFAVMSPEAELRIEWRTPRQAIQIRRNICFAVLGMDILLPIVAAYNRLITQAEKIQVRAIYEEAARGVLHPYQYWRAVRERPKPPLALTQNALFPLPLGNITGDLGRPDDFPVSASYW